MRYIIGRASAPILIFSAFLYGDLSKAQEATIDSPTADSVRTGETKYITSTDSSGKAFFLDLTEDHLSAQHDSAKFDSSQTLTKATSATSNSSIDAPLAAAVTWRIMPLGDSITRGHFNAGSSPEGGYRDDLALMLTAEGVAYDFVGSLRTGIGFDRDHEGHSGQTADYIDANVTSFLQARSPKAVLLHIGTNDITEDQSPAGAVAEIASILDKIINFDPEIRIVLCSTIPRKDIRNPQSDELALLLEELYYEKRAAGYLIFYAGQNEIFKVNPNYKTAYLYDSVHPNNTGYNVIAQVYLNNLLTALTHDDAFITDNFNRSTLGIAWVGDQEYGIAGNQLTNTGTSPTWTYLAVYLAQADPDEASMQWSSSSATAAVRQGGLALRLDAISSNASGYLAYIDDNAMLQLWTINIGERGHLVQSSASALPAPLPGDIFRVSLTTDGSGHHFDYYLNDQFAGRLTDPAKEQGNAGRQFAGVMLRGNSNNPVDDFVLGRTVEGAIPTLTFSSPNGGESIFIGSSYNMTWNSTGSLANVKLEYSVNNGTSWTEIVASTANDGSHTWTVPSSTTSQALVRVSDAADNDPQDASNGVFVIASPPANQYALQFDGVDDYAQISDNALLSGGAGKNLTVEAWVKPQTVSGTRPIVHKYLDGYTKDWGFAIFDGTVESAIESGGDNWELSGGAVAAGVWTHIALVFDNSANVVRLYVNGVQATQKMLSKDMPDSNAPIRIGRHGYGTGYYSGEIEEVRVWNTARSASQITAAMNGQLLGNETGLIGYWSFNEGSGQTAGDGTTNGNSGRLGNATSSDVADPAWVSSTAPLGPVASTLTSSSPNGGESWEVGSIHSITWSSQGLVANVKLEYSTTSGASWTEIVASTANDGNHSWTIPNEVSTQCLVRVADAADGDPSDVSNAVFSIVTPPPATVTLTSPNGGESIFIGSSYNMTWNSTGSLANVKLEYSTTNGASWTEIVASTANDGSHTWTVPSSTTSQALVRVSDAVDNDPQDVSDAVFAIISAPPQVHFTDVTIAANLITDPSGTHGGSVADINNDNLPDIFINSQEDYWIPSGGYIGNYLFLNNGTGTFTRIDATAGVQNPAAYSHASMFFDMDRDGDFDFATGHGLDGLTRRGLFRNNGNLIFTQIDATAGFESPGDIGTRGVIAGDFNGDLMMDITFGSFDGFDKEGYFGDGYGNFTRTYGLNDKPRAIQGLTTGDLDGDGDLDVMMGNFTTTDGVGYYRNNGSRTFSRVLRTGLPDTGPNYTAVNLADVDHDGDLDVLLVGEFYGAAYLYRNNGGSFALIQQFTVIIGCTGGCGGDNTAFGDFDNDGDVDLFIPAGSQKIWLNNGSGSFTAVDDQNSGLTYALDDTRFPMLLDYDTDGDLDILLTRHDASAILLRNDLNTNNAVRLRINGPVGDKGGFGTKVWAYNAGHLGDPAHLINYNEMMSSGGYCIQHEPVAHVGLGARSAIDLRVKFVNGSVTDLPNVAAGQTLEVFNYANIVFKPNGGEIFTVGQTMPVRWFFNPNISAVKLEFSSNNGQSWQDIASSTANDGVFDWAAPNTISSQCLVRVSDASDGDPMDVSNAVFTIITLPPPPAITSFTPTSGVVGEQVTITGANFTGVSSVTFNGATSSSFFVDSATQIRATVPSGATTGKIGVTTPGGAAQSANDFTVNVVSTSFTFIPTHDAYVKSSTATTNYGSATTLRLRKNSSETIYSYLKFAVTGLTGAVQSAKLRLYVTEVSVNGGEAYAVSNNYKGTSTAWVEGGLNWNNAPDISGTVLSSPGAVSLDTWVEFDVTAAIIGNGTFSLGLKSNSTDLVWYASKEGAKKPELVIEASSAAAAKSLEAADAQAEPEDFTLIRNYPNPFNGQTTIEYSLQEESNVRLVIYNALGQMVRELVNATQHKGSQHMFWNGRDEEGSAAGSGVYFYRLQIGAQTHVGRMILQQ